MTNEKLTHDRWTFVPFCPLFYVMSSIPSTPYSHPTPETSVSFPASLSGLNRAIHAIHSLPPPAFVSSKLSLSLEIYFVLTHRWRFIVYASYTCIFSFYLTYTRSRVLLPFCHTSILFRLFHSFSLAGSFCAHI